MTFSLDSCIYVAKGFATINWETEDVYVVNVDTSAISAYNQLLI